MVERNRNHNVSGVVEVLETINVTYCLREPQATVIFFTFCMLPSTSLRQQQCPSWLNLLFIGCFEFFGFGDGLLDCADVHERILRQLVVFPA